MVVTCCVYYIYLQVQVRRYVPGANQPLRLRPEPGFGKGVHRHSLLRYQDIDSGLDTRNNTQLAIKVIELKNITNEVTQYLLQN